MATEQHRSRRDDREPDEDVTPPPAPAPSGQTAEVDDLLDEIDDVLESNAESFVRGFVQKGGQ